MRCSWNKALGGQDYLETQKKQDPLNTVPFSASKVIAMHIKPRC